MLHGKKEWMNLADSVCQNLEMALDIALVVCADNIVDLLMMLVKSFFSSASHSFSMSVLLSMSYETKTKR